MYKEIRHRVRMRRAQEDSSPDAPLDHPPAKKLSEAILQIVVADVSMSLDNVLAVAGVAHAHPTLLIIGLSVSVVLMGAASTLVARLTNRYPWIAYLGLAIILYTAAQMMWDGFTQVAVA